MNDRSMQVGSLSEVYFSRVIDKLPSCDSCAAGREIPLPLGTVQSNSDFQHKLQSPVRTPDQPTNIESHRHAIII